MSHPGLAWLESQPRGREWLDALPRLVGECAERWSLRIGEPYPNALTGLALRVELPDGTPAVLKLAFRDRETEHEAAALAAWDGRGAVRLLAADEGRDALLLERCNPGTPLSELAPDEALDVLASLLPRLWVPAAVPFRSLADEASWWQESLPRQWEEHGRPFERSLLDAALGGLRELAPTQGEQVLLHQDLHADNVLRAEREPWLAIDPKPLAGERELGLAPIVRSSELGGTRRDLLHRLDRLTSELELDRERARRWALAQTLAWSFDGERHERLVEAARWLLQA